MVLEGKNNNEIAEYLDCTPQNVRDRLTLVFNKFNVVNRAGLIIQAFETALAGLQGYSESPLPRRKQPPAVMSEDVGLNFSGPTVDIRALFPEETDESE